jgi:DNA-binding response OmpR family regulator
MKRDPKRRPRILVVDDDPEVMVLLRLALKGAGFSVASAKDGVGALKQARSLLPELILLDVVLPELDGFSVCETLRRDRDTAHIPIIMLTGLSSELNRYAGLDCGADDYLAKPIDLQQLLGRVQKLIGRLGGVSERENRAAANLPARPSTPG